MSRVALKIWLQDEKFFPGSQIGGAVEVTNSGDKPIEVRELYINLFGQEGIKFKITKCAPRCCCFGIGYAYSCEETVKYEDGNTFVDETIMLLESAYLPRGPHTFRFQFTLPQGCPSTYKTEFGGVINYGLIANLKVPGKSKYEESRGILVEGVVNVDKYNLEGSLGIRKANKKVDVLVQLPKRGYILGESIPVKVTVNNLKGSSDNAKISVVKTVQLIARRYGKNSKQEVTVIDTKKWNWASGEWADNLRLLPQLCPPSNLGGAEFIEVGYHLQVSVKGLDVCVPIIIGTIGTAPNRGNHATFEVYQGLENAGFQQWN